MATLWAYGPDSVAPSSSKNYLNDTEEGVRHHAESTLLVWSRNFATKMPTWLKIIMALLCLRCVMLAVTSPLVTQSGELCENMVNLLFKRAYDFLETLNEELLCGYPKERKIQHEIDMKERVLSWPKQGKPLTSAWNQLMHDCDTALSRSLCSMLGGAIYFGCGSAPTA